MPKFHVVPTTEVPQRERARREEAVRVEYVGYIDQIGRTKAGKLTPPKGRRPRPCEGVWVLQQSTPARS